MVKIPILFILVLILTAAGNVQATVIEFHDDWIIQEGDEYDMVNVYDDAMLGIIGGRVWRHIYAYESSIINIFDGEVSILFGCDSSKIYMWGGSIRDLIVDDSSTATLFGGSIGSNLALFDSGIIRIYGYGFDWKRASGIAESGWLSGYWLDGTSFKIYLRNLPEPFPGSHIYLIPEPCTFLLLSLGGLILRRRNSSQ